MIVATLDQCRFGRAEKALLNAEDYRTLEIAWAAHGNSFPEGSEQHRALLAIYQDRSAQFAIEATKYLRA